MSPSANAEAELRGIGRLIRAAEDWADAYRQDPDSLKKLIRAEDNFDRRMRKYFADAAERATAIVDWAEVRRRLFQMYDVIVDTNTAQYEEWENGEITYSMAIVLEDIGTMITIGAQSGQTIYNLPLGIDINSELVQKAAGQYSSKLVKDITTVTRERIRRSVEKSIALGEGQDAATARLKAVVGDKKRAALIARTESVNAYSMGLDVFGVKSGAQSKTWQTVQGTSKSNGACPICHPLNGKTVGVLEKFETVDGRKIAGPTAHPNCRCGKILNYPSE